MAFLPTIQSLRQVSVAVEILMKMFINILLNQPRLLVTMVTVVKQWVKLQNQLLHKYGFNCHTKMIWLRWLPNVTFHTPTLTGARLASTSEV
jgi:hypothetical protein